MSAGMKRVGIRPSAEMMARVRAIRAGRSPVQLSERQIAIVVEAFDA